MEPEPPVDFVLPDGPIPTLAELAARQAAVNGTTVEAERAVLQRPVQVQTLLVCLEEVGAVTGRLSRAIEQIQRWHHQQEGRIAASDAAVTELLMEQERRIAALEIRRARRANHAHSGACRLMMLLPLPRDPRLDGLMRACQGLGRVQVLHELVRLAQCDDATVGDVFELLAAMIDREPDPPSRSPSRDLHQFH